MTESTPGDAWLYADGTMCSSPHPDREDEPMFIDGGLFDVLELTRWTAEERAEVYHV